jgi:hypothetical protein
MNWITGLVIAVACLISGMIGLTAGINLNPVSTVSFVWDWNIAGSWVSGVGALLAVCVALWQSHKQQEREKARCRIIFAEGEWFLKIQIVSEGIIPATVLSACILYDGKSRAFELSDFVGLGVSFPNKIERGGVMTLIDVSRDHFRRLGFRLSDSVIRDLEGAQITPSIYNKVEAEKFFSELRLCSEREGELLIRTAHSDIKHHLPPALLRNLFSLVIEDHSKDLEAKREYLRKDLEQMRSNSLDPSAH